MQDGGSCFASPIAAEVHGITCNVPLQKYLAIPQVIRNMTMWGFVAQLVWKYGSEIQSDFSDLLNKERWSDVIVATAVHLHGTIGARSRTTRAIHIKDHNHLCKTTSRWEVHRHATSELIRLRARACSALARLYARDRGREQHAQVFDQSGPCHFIAACKRTLGDQEVTEEDEPERRKLSQVE